MPWVRFDDQFPIHRKVDGLSDAAFRLHVSVIFWSARNLTNGYVAEEDLLSAAPRTTKRFDRPIAELEKRGCWERNGEGWFVHDYLEYQPSREKVAQERKAKAERQRRWLEKQRRSSRQSNDAPLDASQDASMDTSITPTPPRPAPKEGGGEGAPAAAGGRRASPPGSPGPDWPEWCGTCDNPATRFIEGEDGRVARCPNCHPANTSAADQEQP